MSRVTTCHVSHVIFGGSVINGAYPVCFFFMKKFLGCTVYDLIEYFKTEEILIIKMIGGCGMWGF